MIKMQYQEMDAVAIVKLKVNIHAHMMVQRVFVKKILMKMILQWNQKLISKMKTQL